MENNISLLLYILTFASGFVLDTPIYKRNKNLRGIYVLWLYLFLCFGYMTGSDWRNYEIAFNEWNKIFTKDYGYVYLTNFIHYIVDDFWIVYDGLRCFYLWSIILLLKKITSFWVSALAFLMPMSLIELTVNSPFRFMLALAFLNLAVIYILKSKYILAILFCIVAANFHASIILLLPLLFFFNNDILVKTRNWILALIYMVIVLFTTMLESVNELHAIIGLVFSDFGLNPYKTYAAEESGNIFSFGSISQTILFLFVLFTKSIVVRVTPKGTLVANMAILYFFIQRLGSAIPTGHRFCWLFTLFLAVFFAQFFHIKYFKEYINNIMLPKYIIVRHVKKIFILFFIYYGGAMTKTIVNSFAFIPYTNSIPYIIMGHKHFNERDKYNLDAYKQRTGETFILNTDK